MIASKHQIRLLVSVRNAEEARSACDAGADLIDIKEPSRGPLGMADATVIAAVAAAVRGRCPVSAALGELSEHGTSRRRANAPICAVVRSLAFVKIGLANAAPNWQEELSRVSASLAPARSVAVAYADGSRVAAPPVKAVLEWALARCAAGLLLDTAIKDGTGLFDFLTEADLRRLAARCRGAGLFIALAGSLSGPSFARALALEPDIVAVRGAACAGGARGGKVDADRIVRLRQLIDTQTASAVAHAG
jgi:(5-formylfuran-3-yl)methyl phosphate synthase